VPELGQSFTLHGSLCAFAPLRETKEANRRLPATSCSCYLPTQMLI
jgi:hypothetical protein